MRHAKHTPGPWLTRPHESSIRITSKHGQLLGSTFDADPVDLANANLIAAAPEMLEALQLVFRTLPASYDGEMMEQVEKAINKAKGLK